MIAGLDSSFDRPTPNIAALAYAAGVRVWGGYIGIRPRNELGLATLWSQGDFDVIHNAGMTAIGFCSGWDDPLAIHDRAADWGLLACVDVEPGIRDDGPWVQPWLHDSGAGLYGLPSVHYSTGGVRHAAFHIMATYLGYDPGVSWGAWLLAPLDPCGWQWQGDHSEFGLSVDRSWYDDWFGGDDMTPEQDGLLRAVFNLLVYGATGDPYNVQAALKAVDVNALATALIPHLPVGADPQVVAKAVADELEARLKS